MPDRIVVVGLAEEAPVDHRVSRMIDEVDLVVGGWRHLACLPLGIRTFTIGGLPNAQSPRGCDPNPTEYSNVYGTNRRDLAVGNLDAALAAIEGESGQVLVLASGDPGFFGIVRPLAARFGSEVLEVHPAPSSVSLAFAQIGLSWDDAVVVSAHGRPLRDAVKAVTGECKAALLTSPENRPEDVGRVWLEVSKEERSVVVCSNLGRASQTVTTTSIAGLARGSWDPLSVVILLNECEVATPDSASLSWGKPESQFKHRSNMITKAEVRAVVLSKLDLRISGVLWDVGAGSASVAIEALKFAPGLDVYAIEKDAESVSTARDNAAAHDVCLTVVEGEAPFAFADLPDPDRVFVGGGGLEVLDAVIKRTKPGGQIVATYAAMDRAVEACSRLGNLVQIAVSRGERLQDGGMRLASMNPVFVAWGAKP